MTQDYESTSTSPPAGDYPQRGMVPLRRADGSGLPTGQGRTRIADAVVAKIAALAATEIPGVHAMGAGMTHTLGALPTRGAAGGSQPAGTQGVSVEVGETQAAVDLDLVTYYGQSIIDVTEAVRRNVVERIEAMTALQVTEVNITVDDLFVEGTEDRQAPAETPRAR